MFVEDWRKTLELWIRKAVEHLKQSLKGHNGRSLEDSSVTSGSPDQEYQREIILANGLEAIFIFWQRLW